jgi:hypothetical protein
VWRATRARSRSPRRAGPGRRARTHDMRVNGPPKSAPSPCGAAATFCRLIFGFLAVTFILTIAIKSQLIARFLWANKIGGHGLGPIKGARQPASKSSQFRFRLFSQLSRLQVIFIPTAEVHLRLGEQVSGTLRLLDPAPGEGE